MPYGKQQLAELDRPDIERLRQSVADEQPSAYKTEKLALIDTELARRRAKVDSSRPKG